MTPLTEVAEQIFKAYDVRGLYGDDIDADIAEQLGRAFIRVLADLSGTPAGDLRVGLGRDMRLTAPELAERYKHGMVSEGAHILDAGQVFSIIANGHTSNEENLTANITYWTVATSYDYGPMLTGGFTTNGGGYGYYENADFDAKVATLMANLDPVARQAQLEEAMTILHDDALAIWLWGYPLMHAVNNRVNFALQGSERNTHFNEVTFNA